jgi:protein-tyrosine phosphatase
MAIDKALPNVKQEVKIPGVDEQLKTEVEIQEELPKQGDTEITPTEDGGVEINFEPGAFNQEQSQSHFDNLAELLPEEVLNPLGSELVQNYTEYKASRKDWEDSYAKGLDLLGFKYENMSQPFQGASGATHPVLAEAVTQFQALAYKELLPADGPVRTRTIGLATPQKNDQANRVKEFMNYQLMDQMKEYEPEFDQMLFYLPLAGSAFKKVYYDDLLGRTVSKFVPADDLIVPYNATNLEDADSVIHRIKISENDLRKQQVAGFYRDIELPKPYSQETEVEKKERMLDGTKKTYNEDMYTLLECHTNLDLEGFEDRGPDGSVTGIKLPYIVTVEEGTREILSIRRNYEIADPKKQKIPYFVHFRFLPGLGFYGFGLIHMIGGLSRTATTALRSLLDAGTLSNLPAGFKMRGIRIRDDAQSIQPGEFRDVDAPGGNIKDSFMTLPFKEPSATLLQLMGVVVSAGQRFASIADLQVGEGNQRAAVGTTVALLERGSRTMSAIHKRIYAALKQEFRLMARVFKLYLPNEYPYDVVGGQRMIKKTDFDDKVDIIPVADPNIFSQSQRISIAQTELQLATSNPRIHNMYQAYRNMYEALGVKNIDLVLKPQQRPMPMDPAVEHIQALGGQPFQAFKGQDHQAHITAHLSFMATNMARNNPVVTAALQKNIFEHISLMALEQVEMEFEREILALQQMQQNPQALQDPMMQQQVMDFNMKIESRKAVLIAEMMEEYMKEEKKLLGDFSNDPLARLRARELDIRSQENARKGREAEERLDLDKMRAMMNQQNTEDKMDQNEELANLRANTSIQKTILSKTIPSAKDMAPNSSVIIKGDE